MVQRKSLRLKGKEEIRENYNGLRKMDIQTRFLYTKIFNVKGTEFRKVKDIR